MSTTEILQIAEEFESYDKFALALNFALMEKGETRVVHANTFKKWRKGGGAHSKFLDLVTPVMGRVREIGRGWKNGHEKPKPPTATARRSSKQSKQHRASQTR